MSRHGADRRSTVDPALALIGMAERVKRAAGPAVGLTREAFPTARGFADRWRQVYELAKELQDDYARLARAAVVALLVAGCATAAPGAVPVDARNPSRVPPSADGAWSTVACVGVDVLLGVLSRGHWRGSHC